MSRLDRPVMRPEQPALEQRSDAMDAGKGDVGEWDARGMEVDGRVGVADRRRLVGRHSPGRDKPSRGRQKSSHPRPGEWTEPRQHLQACEHAYTLTRDPSKSLPNPVNTSRRPVVTTGHSGLNGTPAGRICRGRRVFDSDSRLLRLATASHRDDTAVPGVARSSDLRDHAEQEVNKQSCWRLAQDPAA